MKHELPKLPYAPDALEPAMSKETIEYHYGKHHQTYVNNLNDLIRGTEFEESSLEEIVVKSEGKIFNNAAQDLNHTLFFLSFAPVGKAKEKPSGKLMEAIVRDFGSFDTFREQFTNAAVGVFGSGWAWLSEDDSGVLSITTESNAGNPLKSGFNPLMTCDVWEHAYYIDYRNRRPDFLKSFWQILDWATVEKRYGK